MRSPHVCPSESPGRASRSAGSDLPGHWRICDRHAFHIDEWWLIFSCFSLLPAFKTFCCILEFFFLQWGVEVSKEYENMTSPIFYILMSVSLRVPFGCSTPQVKSWVSTIGLAPHNLTLWPKKEKHMGWKTGKYNFREAMGSKWDQQSWI